MGSVYAVTRNRNGRKTQYRTIKYKIHRKWKSEILGRIEIIQKGEAREVLKQRERQIILGQYGLLLYPISPKKIIGPPEPSSDPQRSTGTFLVESVKSTSSANIEN